ncbi:MAG: GNAT family N-acetyltransferase [Burkholderiaceae bacterium]|nr:GNAT family N-acetyltransferase [Burkholderiaceae bacterium]
MKFSIRQATTLDAVAVSCLVTELAHYFVADPASQQVGPFLAGLKASPYAERIASPNFIHYVAEDVRGPCGIIALRDHSHIHHLFVRKDAHGQGIARALWQHAKALSSSSQFTVNSSLFAVPVYEHFGFVAKDSPQAANGLAFVPMEHARES